MRVNKMHQQIAQDEDISVGDYRVKGILDERFEPSPKKPFQSRNDEERDENRTEQDSDGRGKITKGNHAEHGGLCDQQAKHGDAISNQLEAVKRERKDGRLHSPVQTVQ